MRPDPSASDEPSTEFKSESSTNGRFTPGIPPSVGPSILIFSRRMYPDAVGGREVFVADLVETLGNRGNPVRVLTESTRSWPADCIRNLSVMRVEVPVIGFFLFAVSAVLSACAHKDEFEIVHTHSPRLNVTLASFLAKLLGKHHVITVHCSTTENALQDIGTTTAYRDAAAVVAVSPAMVRAVRSQVGPGARIVMIPSASMQPAEHGSRRSTRREIGMDDDDTLLVFLGRLAAHKNPQVLIDAFQLLGREFVEAHGLWLLYVGDGAELTSLRERAGRSPVGSRIKFLGSVPRERVWSLLSACDVFILPSHNEGLGIAVLEAMSSACAVVVADAEGLRDLVADGQTGRLFPAGDIRALSSVVRDLVVDPQARRKLGAAAQAYVRGHFDFSTIVSRHQALYREIVKGEQAVGRLSRWTMEE